jgi:predicted transcriptional regulator YdeE
MKTVEIETRPVWGLSAHTRNADELLADTGRIGPLWADFAAQIAPHLPQSARVYGIYYGYESDAQGAFDVLAGTDALPLAISDSLALTRVNTAPGPYLVFDAPGAMPQAVVDAWTCIWHYFADPLCTHQRAFTTDFECYVTDGLTKIFIAVMPS